MHAQLVADVLKDSWRVLAWRSSVHFLPIINGFVEKIVEQPTDLKPVLVMVWGDLIVAINRRDFLHEQSW
jgi:hypothetical protein